MVYDFRKIEKKWRNKWEKSKVFEVKEGKKKKFYVLDMFPYPSGEGLHMGHAFVFSLGDIYARLKRMQGFNVLYPIGYDSLGLPAENAAIKAGIHPAQYTEKSIANFMKQQKAMGWSYDWSRMVKTSDPEFYKWDQWIFLKMFEKGVAYRKHAPVNWCPECKTVLANEQVVGGRCWRHEDTEVMVKYLEQWFFKTTNYAEELLKGLDKIDWPERAKTMQRNWIGKSHGTEILFEINKEKWPIFTTRPDTIHGVTFMVVSAQHSKLFNLVTDKQKPDVERFLKKVKSVSEKEIESVEKEGVFTGSHAINPINNEKVPVYVGNFVLAEYGSGMVMAVPGHDQRDFDFAKKYNIEIRKVIEGNITSTKAHQGFGKLVNSSRFNDLGSREAIEHITKWLQDKKLGKKSIQFKLRDWLISRQRYWGTPIPIVYCDECGVVPLKEKDLPVKLPKNVKFGKGNPLATNKAFVNTKCPKCKGEARRETDTMDTFVNSSWYYLRYTDPKNKKKIFDPKKPAHWCPVDQYIGGPEHITGHLMYIRFYTKFLKDLGLLKFDEPALRYFTQGIVKGKDGEKMSKSKGNVVEPMGTINKYGADTLRLYLVSNSSPEKDFDWNDKEIQGSFKFVNRVHEYFSSFKKGKTNPRIESRLNSAIQTITGHIENFKYNLAVIEIRELFNGFAAAGVDKKTAEAFLKLLHIFCPYVSEELWAKLDNKSFLSLEKWPKVNEKKINEKFAEEDEMVIKLKADINNIKKILNKIDVKVYVYVMPNEVEIYSRMEGANVYAVNDKKKYDPENKSKKAKPGKPGIYLE